MSRGRDLILKALDNLSEDEFKRFKNKLLTVQLQEGYCHIPRGILLALDRVDLTDKIVSYYLEGYGLEVTVQVLQGISMWEEAVRLGQAAGAVSRLPSTGNAAQSTQPPAAASILSGTHFVDRHRASLIKDVTLLDPVLDKLYGPVLNTEQYEAIRAESTIQKQMRKLYSFTRAWDNACKDQLFDALKETNPFLVQRLERC